MRGRMNFTLIELLVVISIIAILASLLLPALSAAREKGYEARCSGNLKEIGMAMISYVGDCNEEMPPTLGSINGTYEPRSLSESGWFNCGFGIIASNGYIPVRTQGARIVDTNRPAIFRCAKQLQNGWVAYTNWTDYIYYRDTTSSTANMFCKKYSRIGKAMLSFCIAGDNQGRKGLHSNGTEILMNDGSVKHIPFAAYNYYIDGNCWNVLKRMDAY